MKKIIALILVLLMCLPLFAACKSDNAGTPSGTKEPAAPGTETDEPDNSTDSNLTEPGTFPIVKEKVKITVYTHPTPELKVDSYDAKDGNVFSQWYEELTNVELDFVMAPSADMITEHLGILMTSDQIPDILLSNNFSPAQQALYGTQNVIMEITELVRNNAPRIQAMWSNNPEVADAVTVSGGRKYAVNYLPEQNHSRTWNKMWVYKPWLDTLGLPVPSTTDEFYNTLVAFRDNDPNGNGENDEIPLMGNISWVAWDPLVYLMNAFIYNDYGSNIHVDNGKVFAAYMQTEYKEGLKWVSKLFQEGLIAPETFTLNDFSVYKNFVNQDPNIVGFMPSHAPFAASELHYEDFVPVPPLTGPNGLKTATKNQAVPTGGSVISAECELPEVAIRILDGLFDDEVYIRAMVGREGIEWTEAEPGMLNQLGEQAKYQKLTTGSGYDPESGERNIVWPMAMYFNDASVSKVNTFWYVDPDEIDFIGPLNKATEELYVPEFPSDDKLLPANLIYTEEQATEISDLEALIWETVNTYRTKFILGEADVDAEWDAFLAELEFVGINRYLEIIQEAYDAMQ